MCACVSLSVPAYEMIRACRRRPSAAVLAQQLAAAAGDWELASGEVCLGAGALCENEVQLFFDGDDVTTAVAGGVLEITADTRGSATVNAAGAVVSARSGLLHTRGEGRGARGKGGGGGEGREITLRGRGRGVVVKLEACCAQGVRCEARGGREEGGGGERAENQLQGCFFVFFRKTRWTSQEEYPRAVLKRFSLLWPTLEIGISDGFSFGYGRLEANLSAPMVEGVVSTVSLLAADNSSTNPGQVK